VNCGSTAGRAVLDSALDFGFSGSLLFLFLVGCFRGQNVLDHGELNFSFYRVNTVD